LIRESKIFEGLPRREYAEFMGDAERYANAMLEACDMVKLLLTLEENERERILRKDSSLQKFLQTLESLHHRVNKAYQFKKAGKLRA